MFRLGPPTAEEEEKEEDDEDGAPERSSEPVPVTPPAQLYWQRLQDVPPEAVSVPMIVNALVDQVRAWRRNGDVY